MAVLLTDSQWHCSATVQTLTLMNQFIFNIYNSLPPEIELSENVPTFIKKIKKNIKTNNNMMYENG